MQGLDEAGAVGGRHWIREREMVCVRRKVDETD